MHTKQLGRTDLHITPIGFGAWAIGGGDWVFAWGPQDDTASVNAIRRAVDLGVNWIDTAAVYGLGHSETVVARALAEIPATDRPYVFTKCSLVWDENRHIRHSLNPSSIRRECEASLHRLKVHRIDLYQIHWPEWPTDPRPLEPGTIEEAWETMAALQADGKIRHIGVSNFNVTELERIEPIAPVASLQPPYSLLRRDIEAEILPWCEEHHVGLLVYSPMQSGLLSGAMTRERVAAFPADDWRRKNPRFQEPDLTRNLEIVEKLREIGARHGRSPGEVAIAWTLRLSAVTGAIVGARSPEQVDGIIGAGTFRLTEAEIQEIERTVADLATPVTPARHAG
jgi:aryl-alcohol dehydrogenase-like predicted oxidoreductase